VNTSGTHALESGVKPRLRIETPEYADMLTRMVRAYGRRVADGDEVDLARMLEARAELDEAIGVAVRGQRKRHGQSWAYVARGLGTTRQAAQMRYGRTEAAS
jgi:hypothetical protein